MRSKPGSQSTKVKAILHPDGVTATASVDPSSDPYASSPSCYSSDTECITEEDELHLIGENPKPLLDSKAKTFLILNVICLALAITWLIKQEFRLDLLGTIFITLSAWTLIVNCILLGRLFARIKEESLLAGKPDDFREYIRRVANSIPATPKRNSSRQCTKSRIFGAGNEPVFV
ncbi:hypothetical protein Ddc_05344 [Ditylenchus destructor]|nr:hypothetical protein Ddc_05344 [Ditylenchus destructor]